MNVTEMNGELKNRLPINDSTTVYQSMVENLNIKLFIRLFIILSTNDWNLI